MDVRKSPRVPCKVVVDPHDLGQDIAILKCSIIYGAGPSLATDISELKENAEVDIIGYPGEITNKGITRIQGLQDYQQSKLDAKTLLPSGKLIVTRGKVGSIHEDYFTYNAATIHGMSGSCVVYNGKVFGILWIPFQRS